MSLLLDISEQISLSLAEFLTIETCPREWPAYDLYIIRDGEVAFYVGQSQSAFGRVWQHIHDGPKARSLVGRFLLCNWPRSMRFTVTLLSSRSPRFAAVNHDLCAAERSLIEELTPCFNDALNRTPSAIPAGFLPPSAPIKHVKSYKRMLREAEYVVRADRRRDSGGAS
jgi:hypothetical protein